MKESKGPNFLNATILLAGAFTFAFLLGEMVHEYGHYLSHLAFGNKAVGVTINPFGSSHITGVTSLPLNQMGITSAAGPLFDLLLALVVTLSLWGIKRPILLPLLLWGPVAMIQEGVNFSFGLLTPGGDAGWIAALGIPKAIILITGMILIVTALVLISLLLYSLGITRGHKPFVNFLIIFLGMCSLMLIRFVYSAIAQPQYILENLVPLIFSLLLAVIVVLIQPVVVRSFIKNPSSPPPEIDNWAIITADAMGSGMFLFQVLYSMGL